MRTLFWSVKGSKILFLVLFFLACTMLNYSYSQLITFALKDVTTTLLGDLSYKG